MLAIFALSLLIFTQTTLASSSDDDWLDLRDPSHLLDAEKRYAGKYAACTRGCHQNPIDLGLIIDASRSIDAPDFEKGLEFLSNFLDEFDIGPGTNQVRVAAVSFGLGVYVVDGFNFTTYSNKQQVKEKVLKMPHRFGDTADTGKALKYMRELQMVMRRPWTEQIEVVLTDGDSVNGTETAIEAMKTKESNIMVLAVGVKQNVGFQELLNIAGGVRKHVFRAPSYDDLDEDFKNEITRKTCTECHQDPIDLGLIIDASRSIDPPDFEKGLEFLSSFLDEFDIGPGTNQVRVAAVSFGLGLYVVDGFNFTTYSNKQQVKEKVLKMPHRLGDSSDTGKALKYMRELQMVMRRPWAEQIEVVLTDGVSVNGAETTLEAMKTKESNITVLAVGVKQDVGFQELLNIAGGVRKHVFRASSYDDLDEDFKNEITRKTCTDVAKRTLHLQNENLPRLRVRL